MLRVTLKQPIMHSKQNECWQGSEWGAVKRSKHTVHRSSAARRSRLAPPSTAGADPTGADAAAADPAAAEPTGADPTGADPPGADPTGAEPAACATSASPRSGAMSIPLGTDPAEGAVSVPTSALEQPLSRCSFNWLGSTITPQAGQQTSSSAASDGSFPPMLHPPALLPPVLLPPALLLPALLLPALLRADAAAAGGARLLPLPSGEGALQPRSRWPKTASLRSSSPQTGQATSIAVSSSEANVGISVAPRMVGTGGVCWDLRLESSPLPHAPIRLPWELMHSAS